MTIYQPSKKEREGYSIYKELAPKIPRVVVDEMLNDFKKPSMEEMKKQRLNYFGGQNTKEQEQQMIIIPKKMSEEDKQKELKLKKDIEYYGIKYQEAIGRGKGSYRNHLNRTMAQLEKLEEKYK